MGYGYGVVWDIIYYGCKCTTLQTVHFITFISRYAHDRGHLYKKHLCRCCSRLISAVTSRALDRTLLKEVAEASSPRKCVWESRNSITIIKGQLRLMR